MKKVIILILLSSFFACQKKEPVFTLVERNKGVDVHSENWSKYSYNDFILVEDVPSGETELKRLMTYYFFDLTSAIDSLQSNSNINRILCTFLKSTPSTRKRFSLTEEEKRGRSSYVSAGARNSLSWYNNRTYIGKIYISRCKEDETKLDATMYISLGASKDSDFRTGNNKEDKYILLDECNSDWYEANKDNELVKYFLELKTKLTTNR
jgi:hypothetical protein